MVKTSCSIPMPESYAKLIIATQMHLGGTKVSDRMEPYVFEKRQDGVSIFDIEKMWEKFILAARAIAGLSFPETICAISGKPFGRKPVLKFAEAVGCKPITSRFIPGTFTNTAVRGSTEPRLIVVSDPVFDSEAVNEASMISCPVIGFCNANSALTCIDIAIPVNNKSSKAIGASFFILSKLVNYIKNGESLEENLKNVELFFYRDLIELEKLQEEQNEVTVQFAQTNSDEPDFGRSTVEADTL